MTVKSWGSTSDDTGRMSESCSYDRTDSLQKTAFGAGPRAIISTIRSILLAQAPASISILPDFRAAIATGSSERNRTFVLQREMVLQRHKFLSIGHGRIFRSPR